MAERNAEIRGSGLKRIVYIGKNGELDFRRECVEGQNFPKDSGPFTEFDEKYITQVDTTENPGWLPTFYGKKTPKEDKQ